MKFAVKSELLGATSEGNLGAADSPFVSDTLAAVTGDYQSAYAASYYSRYEWIDSSLIPYLISMNWISLVENVSGVSERFCLEKNWIILCINASVRSVCDYSAMQAYSSQSSSAYMPSGGFYNGTSSQTPYGVLAPSTYTAMGVPGTRTLGQQCKNGQSLGNFTTLSS